MSSTKPDPERTKHYLNAWLSEAGYRFEEELFEHQNSETEEDDESEEEHCGLSGHSTKVLKNWFIRCC